jgi:hypothetical protein
MISFIDFVPMLKESHSMTKDSYESMRNLTLRMDNFCVENNMTIINVETIIYSHSSMVVKSRFREEDAGRYQIQIFRVWYRAESVVLPQIYSTEK